MRKRKPTTRNSQQRRLRLRRETLREIHEIDLSVIVGGSDDDEGAAVVLDNGSG